MKRCTLCRIFKDKSEFHKRHASPDGLRPTCKECRRKINQEDYVAKREHRIAQATAYRKNNPEKYLAYRRDLQRRKEAANPSFKLARRLRKRLYDAVKGQAKAGSAIRLLGCTMEQLRVHLERMFLPGMSWENYGTWHVDHVKPLAKFDLQDPVQLAQACHYTNLQPLWAAENCRKRDL